MESGEEQGRWQRLGTTSSTEEAVKNLAGVGCAGADCVQLTRAKSPFAPNVSAPQLQTAKKLDIDIMLNLEELGGSRFSNPRACVQSTGNSHSSTGEDLQILVMLKEAGRSNDGDGRFNGEANIDKKLVPEELGGPRSVHPRACVQPTGNSQSGTSEGLQVLEELRNSRKSGTGDDWSSPLRSNFGNGEVLSLCQRL
jgi:hypothetical protein